MKKTNAILSSVCLSVAIAFSGCCKMMCEGNNITLSFENYRRFEIDTIIFLGYQPGSNFSIRKDSTAYIIPNAAGDTTKASHIHNISANNDWQIKIPSVNRDFRISNYEITTGRCACSNKKYDIVKSYKVNGAIETSDYLRLPR